MAPSVSVLSPPEQTTIQAVKANIKAENGQDVLEDYAGNYKFAHIEEAQVSRAMIKRFVYSQKSSDTFLWFCLHPCV